MNNIARLICLIGILSLTACGGAEDDHAPDEGTAEHSHDGGEPHEHGDADHAREAPATEAFYGDEEPQTHDQ